MTTLYILTVLNNVISNLKKQVKLVAVSKKSKSADKYYQTAKQDKFLFATNFNNKNTLF